MRPTIWQRDGPHDLGCVASFAATGSVFNLPDGAMVTFRKQFVPGENRNEGPHQFGSAGRQLSNSFTRAASYDPAY